VGYVDEPDGSVLVAAGDGAHWALNLFADPTVDVEVGERGFAAVAETPAERLGRGASFRLRPRDRTAT